MGIEVGGILGVVILIADIWATKVVWTVVILLLPVVGLIVWFFAGPRSARAT